MSKIFKYPLKLKTRQIVGIPQGAKIIALQVQKEGDGLIETPCLWALVPSRTITSEREIRIYATGEEFFDDDQFYIGTSQLQGGLLVFHVFQTYDENS